MEGQRVGAVRQEGCRRLEAHSEQEGGTRQDGYVQVIATLLTSRPWQWPLNYRGQFFSASKGHKIYLLGNPIIWWANIATVPLTLLIIIALAIIDKIAATKAISVAKLNSRQASIETSYLEAATWALLGWTLHYIPFYFMGRVLYFHHYFPAFLFSCMLTAMTCDYLITVIGLKLGLSLTQIERRKMEFLVAVVSIAVYTFAKFIPLTYGTKSEGSHDVHQNDSTLEAWRNEQQLSSLKWLDSWEF